MYKTSDSNLVKELIQKENFKVENSFGYTTRFEPNGYYIIQDGNTKTILQFHGKLGTTLYGFLTIKEYEPTNNSIQSISQQNIDVFNWIYRGIKSLF